MQLQRAVFVDRDGVINVNRADNVRSWEQFAFEQQSLPALARLAASDFRVLIITNQAGIGLGHMSFETVNDIHEEMIAHIARAGGRIDRVYLCPHTRQDKCTCRKPSPEMLLRGRDEFGLDLQGSYFVGDWVDDVYAAQRAGVIPILVRTGRGELALGELQSRTDELPYVADNLYTAVDWILSREQVPDTQKK
jgi:D-glycero-D-manno-heptose 1,7-bisphosphate phosphatase